VIGYLTLGSNDIEASSHFYTPFLEIMGAVKVAESDTSLAWSFGEGKPLFLVRKPFDGNEASNGNGAMIALNSSSCEEVDKLNKKAIALGGQNEGDPGVRSGGFYCAYFRDPSGNKLIFYCSPDSGS